jgi:quinol-cytochrome oxidoreductase complex cytochrome b subunit
LKLIKEHSLRPSFYHHLHPPTIPAPQSRFLYTLGAGGLSIYLSLVVGITGILEMFYYIPTPDKAAQSIQSITFLVPYGAIIRNLHFWAAQLLVITILVHLIRVIFTGAYGQPRRFNYLLGFGLFIITLLINFTGYILRWDEGVHWALTTGTNLVKTIPLLGDSLYNILVGGNQPGPATLIRFYAFHVPILSTFSIILIIWHIFRIRRDGGIAVPPPQKRSHFERITRFDLVRREVLAILIASILLLLIAALFPAPLAAPISTQILQNSEAKAPWFLLWIQQLLKYGDPFIMGVLVPSLIFLIIAFMPYIFPPPPPQELGRWLPKGTLLPRIITAIFFLFLIILSLMELASI